MFEHELLVCQPKHFVDGTHRIISPAETVARVRPHMAAMGITRVANITGLDRIGIPVVVAVRPNSRSLSVSQGKGLDIYAAKASALMETIESYHAEWIDLPLRLGSYRDLCGSHRIIETERLPRSALNLYREDVQLLWIEAFDLIERTRLWIPYELVHTRFTLPRATGSGCFYASSNGLASGNHRLEALSHAICEVIERDAITLWHLMSEEERDAVRVDPDTVDDLSCRQTLELYERAGIDVVLWNATSNVGVPCFVCQIADRDRVHSLYAASGMGCHPSRAIALLRALTEAAQGRLTLIAGSRDDVFRDDYNSCLNPIALERHQGASKVNAPMQCYNEVPNFITNTFNDDLTWLFGRLQTVGIERVVAVDLTRMEFGLPVVKVIIPGLESLISDPNYYPGPRANSKKRILEL